MCCYDDKTDERTTTANIQGILFIFRPIEFLLCKQSDSLINNNGNKFFLLSLENGHRREKAAFKGPLLSFCRSAFSRSCPTSMKTLCVCCTHTMHHYVRSDATNSGPVCIPNSANFAVWLAENEHAGNVNGNGGFFFFFSIIQ